ncbi:MAG: toxin-antitoxin system YwqK family antitoxin [Cyclobacteriaceae bacterium]
MALLEPKHNNINFICFFLWLVALGCSQPDVLSEEEASIQIPDRFISSSDAGISKNASGDLFFMDSLFSGYLQSYYTDGSLQSKSSFYMGKLEGDKIHFYPNGDTAQIRPYHDGKKHGKHLAWYKNRQLKFEYYFVEGLSEGNHWTWYENGNLNMDMNFKDGRELGSQKVYRMDGKLRTNYVRRENGRKYGLVGLKRCAKIDSESGNFDPYKSTE